MTADIQKEVRRREPMARTASTVRQLMESNVISASADTDIARIAQLMEENAISGLPVVDDSKRVIGIVTEFDLIIRHTPIQPPPSLPLLEGHIPLETQRHFKERIRHRVGTAAEDLMTRDVVTIGPDEDIERLAGLMVKAGINMVPVVEHGKLVGVVARADVVRWMVRR